MKNLNLIMMMIIATVLVSCAKSKVPNNSKEPETYEPVEVGPGLNPGDSDGSGNWEYGGGANIEVSDLSTFDDYTGVAMTASDMDDIFLNINLKERANDLYAGTVTIEYDWNGKHYVDYFKSGDTEDEIKNNKWVNVNGKTVWHGVFEDMRYGSIILVFDEYKSLGDGDGGPKTHVSGKVFYKNFERNGSWHPPQLCWTITIGPYACQTWKEKAINDYGYETTVMNTNQAIYPNPEDGYKELGSFKDIELKKAFNQ